MKLLDHPTLTWGFHAESDSGTAGRAIAYPRGRVLGGSSSINGMIYVRGHPEDFDYWAQLGNRGWSWDDVLPFFRKAENWEGEADAVHGKGVERSRLIPGCQCLIRGSALCVTQRTTRIRSSRNPPRPRGEGKRFVRLPFMDVPCSFRRASRSNDFALHKGGQGGHPGMEGPEAMARLLRSSTHRDVCL
jgi:choline dehydrogenase-like flavoprotein